MRSRGTRQPTRGCPYSLPVPTLFVSVRTVQIHLTHIYAKVGVGSRAELAARLRDDTAADVATATEGGP